MNIIESNLSFGCNLVGGNKPSFIVLHHAASKCCSIEEINMWHKKRGFAGCGYHFFIRKDGKIYRGRKEDQVGAHTMCHNRNALGVCCEGNFMVDRMGKAQYNSLLELLKYLCGKYKIHKIYGHREFNSTSCPGRYFPLEKVKTDILGKSVRRNVRVCYPRYLLKYNPNKKDYNVKLIQEKLISKGYSVGACGADGYFGKGTHHAVINFQAKNGLMVDGIVGPDTWEKIMN